MKYEELQLGGKYILKRNSSDNVFEAHLRAVFPMSARFETTKKGERAYMTIRGVDFDSNYDVIEFLGLEQIQPLDTLKK